MARTPTAPPRCLLVEDEVLIGMDLDECLHEGGFDVRWVASAQSALEVLSTASFDIAVLDVVVRSEPCTKLARELRRRHVPFLVYSGCPRDGSPPEFGDAPWLGKPAEPTALVAALAGIVVTPDAHRREGAEAASGLPQASPR